MTRELLARCSFPPAGTEVDCAVSGGADSLALLALAVEAGCVVTVHHVDHGLRPGSAVEADRVRVAAERFGAAFRSHAVHVPAGPNLEARARAARYGALPEGVLTGHTADDQAETVLLNLVRGAGLDGLAGMAPARRPLRRLRRVETQGLCVELGLDVFHDPSNDDPAFRRNRVRHELLPLLDDLAQRDVVPVLARQADLLRDDAAVLAELAADLLLAAADDPAAAAAVAAADTAADPAPGGPTAGEPGPEGGLLRVEDGGSLDARVLARAPVAVARRAVRAWLRDGGAGGDERHPPDAATVARVLDVARGDAVACDVGRGWRAVRSKNRMRLHPPGD